MEMARERELSSGPLPKLLLKLSLDQAGARSQELQPGLSQAWQDSKDSSPTALRQSIRMLDQRQNSQALSGCRHAGCQCSEHQLNPMCHSTGAHISKASFATTPRKYINKKEHTDSDKHTHTVK